MIWFCLWFFPAFLATLWAKDADERSSARIYNRYAHCTGSYAEKKPMTRGDFLLCILFSVLAGPLIGFVALFGACFYELQCREWINKPLIKPKSK